MKIDLPLENWVDFFKLLSREQLAALLPHIGDEQEETKNRPIANRQFVSYVQFYLHKCGAVTLGHFSIESSRKGPVFVNKAGQKLPLAEVPRPMPSYIESFKKITINYYDQSVLDFLQEFRHNSMLTNVHLILNGRKYSKMMTQLLPSITSIESLIYERSTAVIEESYSDMLTSVRILYRCDIGCGGDYDDWYRHWLHIPRDDGKPRVLVGANVNGIDPTLSFIEKIKKDFLDAKQAVSFFACIVDMNPTLSRDAANVQPISLANYKTQEKLVIKAIDPNLKYFVTISRYPMGATEEWIEENAQIIRDRTIFCPERIIEVNIKSGNFTCSLI